MSDELTIEERTFAFALDIVTIYRHLKAEPEYILSGQLLKSGTSIGANVSEAQAAQSKKDFIAKMSIASKEARETRYWLRLPKASHYLDTFNTFKNTEKLFSELDHIINILTKIVKTAQTNEN